VSAESVVNTLISNALTIAQQKSEAAQGFTEDAQSAVDEAMFELESAPTFGGGPTAPVLDKPITEDGSTLYKSEYDSKAGELTGQLAGIFSGFLNDYFPPLGFCLDSVETWICNTINNGGTGIPAAVEAQIWQRGRDKEALEAARLEDEALTSFAARGFTLPPGALAHRILMVQQDAANKNSSFGRDVAIKQVEIEIENIRFAITTAVNARLACINAAIEYWKAYLLPHDIAARRANAIIDAKTNFSNALAAWFNSQVGLYNADVNMAGHFWNAANNAYMARAKALEAFGMSKAKVAADGAQAQSAIAAAAMSAMNTLAQYGYAENKAS
jgi:hypothetical protein